MVSRIPLIPSLEADADPTILARVERLVALWCARSVESLSTDARVKACNDATEGFLAGTITASELDEARAHVALATNNGGVGYYAAHYAAYAAANAAQAAAYAAQAATSAANAAQAATNLDDALLDWLDRLLTMWQKIAADEGLMGSCGWIDPAEFVQTNGS